jgi:4-carboxymuconolactone decarboxylase
VHPQADNGSILIGGAGRWRRKSIIAPSYSYAARLDGTAAQLGQGRTSFPAKGLDRILADGVFSSERIEQMARLPPITSKDQVPVKDHAIVDAITQSRGAIQGPFTMFLHCPELAGRLAHLGAFVRFEGSLDMRVRVLAAMTVARELEAVYVWGAQTGGARRLGVPEATITAIRENHSRGIPPEDAEIVDFTRQLLRKHRADDAPVNSLRRRFGNDGFIQLTGAIGYYSMLAMTVNACELEAAPNAEILQT